MLQAVKHNYLKFESSFYYLISPHLIQFTNIHH